MNQIFRGINIEIGDGNPGAIGLYAQGAQGMAVNDVQVDMTSGGGFAGFAGGNGAGGSHVNIAAMGGRYGVFFEQADGAALVLSGTFEGQTISAVHYTAISGGPKPWESSIRSASLVGLTIRHNGTGPAIDAGQGHAITVLDTIVHCDHQGDVNQTVGIRARGNVYLQDTFFVECGVILTQPGTFHPDLTRTPRGYPISHAIAVARGTNTLNRGAEVIGNLMVIDGVRLPNHTLNRMSPVAAVPSGVVSSRTPWVSNQWPSIENMTDAVVDCGAKGDGTTDDTDALQHCLNENQHVLLPKGLFRISSTLLLRPGASLIGISQTHSVIAPMTTGFKSEFLNKKHKNANKTFAPLVRTAITGNVTIAFVGLVTWWHLPSIFTLEWRARGGLWRSNYETRVCECLWLQNYASRSKNFPCAQPVALATPKTQIRGGGVFVNFVNDEDILFTDHTNYRHLYVGDGGTGSHPLQLYALNMEHAMSEANLEINGAHQGVEIVSLKIEGSNTILWVRDCSKVELFSLGGGADPFPNSSYLPSDFAPYTPTILRVERTSPFKFVNVNDGGRGNEGQPIQPIPPTGGVLVSSWTYFTHP